MTNLEKNFNEWTYNNKLVRDLISFNDLEEIWGTEIDGELYICSSLKNRYGTTIGYGTKTGKVISDKITKSREEKIKPVLARICQLYKKQTTINEDINFNSFNILLEEIYGNMATVYHYSPTRTIFNY